MPAGKGTLDAVTAFPPDLKKDAKDRWPRMAVRGGSFYHQPPGEAAGESQAEILERRAAAPKTPPPPPEKGKAPPPPEEVHQWRAMDLVERRGIPADLRAKWIGFRVVLGTDRSTTAAK